MADGTPGEASSSPVASTAHSNRAGGLVGRGGADGGESADSPTHVNVGFFRGAELRDPAGLA